MENIPSDGAIRPTMVDNAFAAPTVTDTSTHGGTHSAVAVCAPSPGSQENAADDESVVIKGTDASQANNSSPRKSAPPPEASASAPEPPAAAVSAGLDDNAVGSIERVLCQHDLLVTILIHASDPASVGRAAQASTAFAAAADDDDAWRPQLRRAAARCLATQPARDLVGAPTGGEPLRLRVRTLCTGVCPRCDVRSDVSTIAHGVRVCVTCCRTLCGSCVGPNRKCRARCADCGGLETCPICDDIAIGPTRPQLCPCCVQRCSQCGARVCPTHFMPSRLILELDDELAPVHPRGSCVECVDAERNAVDFARQEAWQDARGGPNSGAEHWHVF